MELAAGQAILGLGVFFILFGVVSIFLFRKEEGDYYNSILSRRDLKEFINHEPERLWLGAWRVGGKVSLIIGVPLAITGGVFWLMWY